MNKDAKERLKKHSCFFKKTSKNHKSFIEHERDSVKHSKHFMVVEPFACAGALSYDSRTLDHISPHCAMTMGSLGLLLGPTGTFCRGEGVNHLRNSLSDKCDFNNPDTSPGGISFFKISAKNTETSHQCDAFIPRFGDSSQ